MDTRTPFRNLSLWLSKLLNLVAKQSESTILDSKAVICDLTFHNTCDPNDILLSADLEDYFPRIDLQSLRNSLEIAINRYFGENRHVQELVSKILLCVLENKHIRIGATILRKKRSLSIGETIATAAANIHRDISFEPILTRAKSEGIIKKHYGYVDDTLTCCRRGVMSLIP